MAKNGVGFLPDPSLFGVGEWLLFAAGLAFGSIVLSGPIEAIASNLYHGDTSA